MNTVIANNTNSIRLGNKGLFTNVNTRNNPTLNIDGLETTRYFSGVDAEIYFGDIMIDEAVSINFTIQQNTLPIFGYNSYTMDTCAQGSRLIQGSFSINFTKSNYLYEVVNALDTTNSGAKLYKANYACNNTTMHKSNNHPMWDKCIDIVLSYGNYKVTENNKQVDLSTMITLRGVYIIGCDQGFGTNQQNGGVPIYENYIFYARDIEFDKSYETPEDTAGDEAVIEEAVDVVYITGSTIVSNEAESYDISLNTYAQPDCTITAISLLFQKKYCVNLNYSEALDYADATFSNSANSYSSQKYIYDYLLLHQCDDINISAIVMYEKDGISKSVTQDNINISVPYVKKNTQTNTSVTRTIDIDRLLMTYNGNNCSVFVEFKPLIGTYSIDGVTFKIFNQSFELEYNEEDNYAYIHTNASKNSTLYSIAQRIKNKSIDCKVDVVYYAHKTRKVEYDIPCVTTTNILR